MLPLSIPAPGAVSFDLTQWLASLGLEFFGQWNLPIRFSAIAVVVAIVVALWLTSRRLTKRGAEPGIVVDLAIWAVPLGYIGARLWFVLEHPSVYFDGSAFPGALFAVWDGGYTFTGGLIGGAIGALIGSRLSGIRFWSFADALAPALLVGQAIGRVGDYFDLLRFGVPTTLPWGLEVPATTPGFPAGLADGTLFQPVFLYEIVWDLVGAALLVLVSRRFALQWGKVWGLYLIWFGLGRWWMGGLRIDVGPLLAGVRLEVWAGWLAIVLGLVVLVVQARRHPGVETGPYRPGAEWAGPAGVESTDTYSDDELEGEDAPELAENEAVEPSATSEIGAKSPSAR